MTIDAKILEIAEEVRVWGEILEANDICFENLRGLCAICSVELFVRLQERGFKPLFCLNSMHAFIIVDDHIVDVTATQFRYFDNKKILILHREDSTHTAHDIDSECDNIDDIIETLDEVNWPDLMHPDYFMDYWEVPYKLAGKYQEKYILSREGRYLS